MPEALTDMHSERSVRKADSDIGGESGSSFAVADAVTWAQGWLITRLSERWSIPILVALREKALRFARLKQALGTVSHRMLIRSLKNLERDGLVRRVALAPTQISYELTSLGRSLLDPLDRLAAWQRDATETVMRANSSFDTRPSEQQNAGP